MGKSAWEKKVSRRDFLRLAALLFGTSLSSACKRLLPSPTPTPPPTATIPPTSTFIPSPTATSTPVATDTPTSTPTSTATQEPSPTPTKKPTTTPKPEGFPEPPEPTRLSDDINIGCYYITGWGTFPGQRSSDWYLGTNLHPLLDFYRSDDPRIADWHIYWLVENGIAHVMVLSTNPGRGAISGWENNFERGFLKSSMLPYIQFSMVFNNGPFRTEKYTTEDRLELARHAMSYFASRYFPHKQYKRIDEKPIVDLHQAFIINDVYGYDELARTVETMRKTAKDHGYSEIFLVGDVFNWERMGDELYEMSVVPLFDAISSYTVVNAGVGWKYDDRGNVYITDSYDNMVEGYKRMHEHYSQIAKKYGVGIIQPTTPGFSNEAIYKKTDDWLVKRTNPTPKKFQEMCESAKEHIDPKLGMISVEAFNEYQEESVIEPNDRDGFKYLNLLRDVFYYPPKGGWSPNIVPTRDGKIVVYETGKEYTF
jgi:hypothetical protein